MKNISVAIVGGGIAGLTTAIALENKGIHVEVYESSNSIHAAGAGLGLGINAMLAFNALGIYDEVVAAGKQMPSFSIYDDKGGVITRTEFKSEGEIGNFVIHRADLHHILLSKLNPKQIHLGKKLERVEQSAEGVSLYFMDDSPVHCDYLIAAEGIHSVVRNYVAPESKLRYSGYTCWRAVVNNPHKLIEETSETWGRKGRIGMVQINQDQVYWFACINAKKKDQRFKNVTPEFLATHFSEYPKPIPALLRNTPASALLHNDIIDIEPLNRYAFERIVLIGDAAHATTPNMGQGACQAIEDAVVLANSMEEHSNFEKAFQDFEQKRLTRCKWIVNTSYSLGKAAQLENAFLIALRNFVFRRIPKRVSEKQMKKLEDVAFGFD